ncbi:FtsX-like permease family protein [Shewanella colwelliana]|uniref:ABC transporter permease n=1 Tax=Shewanella colwelliana TaxID=23 RepID=UPI00299F1EDF|nr:FtsX-like permease family protein [Shewanella colwelliana]MDX1283158.1 FtsX-like permease family protein [Shewanella colwelliana]
MSNPLFRGSNICLQVFLAHYRQSPLQAGAIIVGIILAVTLLTGVRATNENAINSYSSATELLSQQAKWLITPAAQQKSLDEQRYIELRGMGINQSLAVVQGWVTDDNQQRWQLQGSDIIAAISALRTADDAASQGSPFAAFSLPLARIIAGEPLVLMSQSAAQSLAKKHLVLSGSTLEVVPVDDSFNLGNRLLVDISLAQQLLDKPGQLSYIAIFSDISHQQSAIEQWLTTEGNLSESDNGDSMKALTNSFHLNLTAMSLLAFIVGLFIAYNGVRYSLLKRKRLIIQLQQQGIMKLAIMTALGSELLLLVLVGSLVGFVLGLQLSYWLQPMVSVTLEQLYGANILPGIWRWQWLAQATLLTLAAALLACSSLFVELLRQPLAQSSGQFSQQKNAHRAQKWQMISALTLALIALIFMPISQDYRITMGLLGLVVLAIPLSLPWLLVRLINAIAAISPKGLMGYQIAETKELIPPLSLAMMAMLLALTANISMNSLVGSFEVTLKQWLNARLHADLYLRPPKNQMAELQHLLSQDKQVTGIYRQWLTKTTSQHSPIFLLTRDRYSIENTTVIKSANGASNDQLWQRYFDAANTSTPQVIVSEPFAIKQKLNVGDSITVDALGNIQLIIAAIYYDYGNPYGEVIIPPALWHQAKLNTEPLSIAITYSGDFDAYGLVLQQRFALPESLIYSQARIKAQAIEMFKRTFSITQVLNTLTLLVAAIGLFSACYMLTQARMAPIARLYTLGVNRQQLTVMVTTQMLLMVLLTCLVALPTGAILGYLLIHKVTLQAFGWSIAMVWDWQAYFDVVVLALVASALAVALPLYRQTRRPLISSLQSDVL